MERLDIILIILFFTMIAFGIYSMYTVRQEGTQCLVNPYDAVINNIERLARENVTCSCGVKGGNVIFNRDGQEFVKLFGN